MFIDYVFNHKTFVLSTKALIEEKFVKSVQGTLKSACLVHIPNISEKYLL